jgi:hypothetical protein
MKAILHHHLHAYTELVSSAHRVSVLKKLAYRLSCEFRLSDLNEAKVTDCGLEYLMFLYW